MADGYISQIKTPDNKTYLLKDSEKTDEKVKQTSNTEDKEFPILFKNANNATEETAGVKYSGNITADATTTKPFTFNPSTGNLTVTQLKIGTKNDNMGLFPNLNNWNQIGSGSLYWYRSYINNYYGGRSHVDNWDSGKNIGTAASASAAAVLGTVNFYNTAAAGATQTKTLLTADSTTNSNITITLPKTTGTLALKSELPTLSGLSGIGTISASGTAPLTLSGSKSGTTYTLTGSVADASASASGIVNTDAQTFSGVKTFDNGLHIYGTISTQGTGSAAGTMYPGGAYHSGHNSIILHGDTAGISGIGFTSEKAIKSGTTTNINGSSDRAFIQYHAYGVTPAAEGTAPTLATSGELGTLVIGVGNDATDTIRLQAPGTTGILHQIGATAYPIPHTTNTNGSVGGTTTPVYVDAGVIKAGTALGTASQKAESYFVKAITSTDEAIVRFSGTAGQVQDSKVTINDNGTITLPTEQDIDFRMNRKTADGGGWAHGYLNWYDKANNIFAVMGLYGTNDALDHIYIGSNTTYSSDVNLQIYANGTIKGKLFSGSGASLTSLNASNLSSGTVPVARLPLATTSAAGAVKIGSGISVSDGTISVTASNLGLSNAMHFIGVATKAITDGGTEDPTISGYSTKTAGDVVIDKDTRREYVWSTAGKWEMLGFDASAKYEKTTSGNTFISKITQATDGTVTAESRALDTSGTWSGNATTATTATNLANNPSIQASTSNTNQVTITAGGKTSSAYTIPYATSAGSATSATTATYIKCTDTRNTALNPTDLNAAQGIRFDFKAKGTINLTATDAYAGVMSFRPYASNSDWFGGNAHQLAFNSEGLHWRNGGASWGNWHQILDSNNTTTGTNNNATLTWNTTYTIAKINGTDIKFTTMTKPTYAFSDLTSHPTTLSDYGITNAVQYNGIDNDIGSSATAANAKSYWANNNKVPKGKVVFNYNSSGTEFTTLFSNNNNSYGSILRWGYQDTYIRILRAHPNQTTYSGWYTEDWEKISAGYADSAGTATSAGKWTTARTLTIGSTGKSVDGSGNVSWSLAEIGAAPAVTGGYLPLSGGTLTGALTTANGTWNTMGDDAYFGDINKAGHIGIKGKNGNTGLFFTTYNQSSNTTGGAITWDGTKFSITSDTAIAGTITNATSATSAGKWTTARNISISDSDGTNTGTAVSVDGSAAVTLKLPATIKATVIGDGSQLTSLKTQNLVRPAGLNGVNDVTYQALINDVRANRLAFLPADQIIIEKTTDGGITWEDAGISDGTKTALFSETRPGVSIPKINNEINTSCGLRITITAMKYDVPAGTPETQKYNYWNSSYVKSTERYNQIKLMYFWVSTATNALKVTVQKATGANPNSWINVFSNNNYGMTGWSGNDIITFGQGVFGGGTTQTGNTWNWRITLMTCGPNGSDTLTQSNLTSTMMVSEIRGYGDTYWTAGNKYAASDHLYSWDYNKNATFPSNITASKFIGALQGNADTATKFNSTRKIELTGAVTGSATTDGSSGWTISTTVNHNHDTRYNIASGVITLGSNTITPVTSVNGHSGSSVSVTASDLGLASALKYVGTKSSLPTATDSTTYSTYNNGDVITVSAKEYAYVKGSNAAGSSWVELGDEGSYKLKQTAFTNSTGTADGTNTSTAFIYSFSQDENGAISNIKTRQLPTLTNVSYTAATDNNEYPVLMKNSIGSDTTAAGVRFASGTNQQVTINPSTGTVSTRRLVINNSSSNGTVPDLVFSRTSWSYINIPDNDAAVLAIGRGTGDNASQKLIIQGDGTVRPGSDNTQFLGTSARRWQKIYGVNFYGTFNGTATSAQQLAAREIDNSDLNQFSSGGALKYAWVSGGNNILSKPTNVNAFGVIAMKTAASWTGQLLMSTDTEPGLYWRTNLTTETPTYGAWAKVWDSSNHRVFYGTCTEAAGTAAKPVVCTNYDEMRVGDIIIVKFDNTNTAASPTLNVNGKGSKSVKMAYSGGTADLSSYTQLAGIRTFIYDGTNWILQEGECVKQGVTDTTSDIWRPVMLGAYNSTDVRQAPEQRYAMIHAARNVKYHQATGTLRAPILKTPKLSIEYSFEDKAHIQWNDTDSSIDFIFD